MEGQTTEDNDDLQQQITELRTWLEQKPYVPKNIDDKLYRRFMHSCYYDLERTKTAADLFFSIRSTEVEMLTNRDPLSPPMQKTIRITHFCRYRISENRCLLIWQIDDPGFRQYDHYLESKIFILASDAWILDDNFLEEENIIIADVKDVNLRAITKFSYSVGKKMSRYQQEAVPLRIKQIHLVNAPSVIHRVFSVLRPFLSKDLMNLMHIHTPKSTTIYDYVSKDDLPEDYGGTRGKLSDYVAETMDCIMKNRECLIDENFWRIDPSLIKKGKSTSKPVGNATAEISSLRTLAID